MADRCVSAPVADGRPCGATRMLEIDHLLPVARGGGDEASNLNLVCRDLNQYWASLMMGHRIIDRYQS